MDRGTLKEVGLIGVLLFPQVKSSSGCHPHINLVKEEEKCIADLLLYKPERATENHTSLLCKGMWDDLNCWPAASVGHTAVQPCPEFFNSAGTVRRNCTASGWSDPLVPHEDACGYAFNETLHFLGESPDAHKYFSSVKTMYTAGYALSLISLSIAVTIFCLFRKLHCTRNHIHIQLFVSFILKAIFIFIRDSLLFTDEKLYHCDHYPVWTGCAPSFLVAPAALEPAANARVSRWRAGGLQGGAHVLQLLHPGELQLAAGGRTLPLHAGEPLLLLPEETPGLVHRPELGRTSDCYCLLGMCKVFLRRPRVRRRDFRMTKTAPRSLTTPPLLPHHLTVGIRGGCALLLHERRGAAGVPEEVAAVAVDPAPAQPAAAPTRLHQPQRVAPHAGVPAALLHGRPDRRRTPRRHAGGVTQAGGGLVRAVAYNAVAWYFVQYYAFLLFVFVKAIWPRDKCRKEAKRKTGY
ncbi:secretin receptor isoform 2-T2 [Spinachia spinachia]